MKVKLISFTQDAFELLLGTKTTRMRGKDPSEMTPEEQQQHWRYMLDTIRSPFEFVDFIFEISGVSKNFTHQLVRTRTGAYQQETSRALECSASSAIMPVNFSGEAEQRWHDAMADIDAYYGELIGLGAELQDARAIMPSNMSTAIKAKFNLRTLSDMAKVRLCTRTQGEYQHVFREMRRLVLEQYPMFESLLQPACVATGQCAFPRHGKDYCPFWRDWMDLESEKSKLANDFWSVELYTNNPVASGGTSKG